MLRAFLRSVFWPPAYAEALSPAQWRQLNLVRMTLGVFAIVTDVAIVVALRGHPTIHNDALWRFGVINISILMVVMAMTVATLRLERLRRPLVMAAMAAFETLTVIVWTQATGSMTSYFMLVGALMIFAYRMYFSFAVAATVTCALFVFHGGALALELTGVIDAQPLFVGEPSVTYQLPAYQAVVILSIVWTYLVSFITANALTNKLNAKELALAEVQAEMARVAKDIKHGRLSGSLLDGEYALGELIGRGGMGEIYSARRVSDETTVAVKVLHGHLVDDTALLERFRREASVAEQVPARYRARIFEVGNDAKHELYYIAMEYLRGEDLAAHLRRRGPRTPEQLLPLARTIAKALDAAHEAGVVHRDLKPQNVFLVAGPNTSETGRAEVRLLDFGMSRLVDSDATGLTQADALIGTLGYLAPEQATGGAASAGPAADRFAFAALLYRALTGKLPFTSGDIVAAIHEVLHCHPPPASALRPQLHRDIDAVLTIGLAKRPQDRYASATAMVKDLAAAAGGALDAETHSKAATLDAGIADAATLAAN